MRLTSSDQVEIEPGDLVRWFVEPVGEPSPSSTPLSENETFHLASSAGASPGWIALTLDYSRPLARVDVDRVLRTFVERHDVLRCHYAEAEGGFMRVGYPAARLEMREAPPLDAEPGAAFTDALMSQISQVCNPLHPMPHYFAAIERSDSTTLVLAFDHCYVDARALAVLSAETDALLAGQPLAEGESGLAMMDRVVARDAAVLPDDPRLLGWGEFLADSQWCVPEFPIDLGLRPGQRAPAHTQVRTLLSAGEAECLSAAVHRAGSRTYPAVLTCAGFAIRQLGGPAEIGTVIPTPEVRESRAVAWLVGNAPLLIDCDGDDIVLAIKENAARLADALPLAQIGLTPVYQEYGARLRRERADVFMMSYVDYTRLPGADTTGVEATQISSEKPADTAQWWFWRDHSGIHVRVRHPDTDRAIDVVAHVLDRTADLLRDLAQV